MALILGFLTRETRCISGLPWQCCGGLFDSMQGGGALNSTRRHPWFSSVEESYLFSNVSPCARTREDSGSTGPVLPFLCLYHLARARERIAAIRGVDFSDTCPVSPCARTREDRKKSEGKNGFSGVSPCARTREDRIYNKLSRRGRECVSPCARTREDRRSSWPR